MVIVFVAATVLSLVLTPASAAGNIAEAVTRRAAVDGHPEPVVREVHPAGGARRER